jgi:hypothetical protein
MLYAQGFGLLPRMGYRASTFLSRGRYTMNGMDSAAHPNAASSFSRPQAGVSVETLLERLEALTLERQQLRAASATPDALERNRMTIARTQWELSYALIERHLPGVAA